MLVPPVPTAAATLATAATLARPSPHPPMTTAFASRILELRQAAYTSENLSYDLACIDYIDALSCDSAYVSCLTSVESDYYTYTGTDMAAYSKMATGLSACYCNYGVQYLSCYYSAIEGTACVSYFGTYDWRSYESYWYLDNCGTVPPTLFDGGGAKTTKDAKPPTSVSLDLQSVEVVTISTPPPIPTYTYSPLYQSTGNLLQDECASTQFTLMEDVSTVYWAAYIGCASNQPQCCPWTAMSEFFPATVTGNTTVTVTSTLTAGATKASGTNVALNAFPAPANQDQSVLKHCASDYYSISGQCCPSNYWPFTRDLGGQTPCYSSLAMVTQAPTLTEGLIGQPTDTQKPTSAVINVVWAMSYPVESKSSLSKGAIAGIVVAAVVVIAALAALSFFLIRARRKNKILQQQQQQQPGAAVPPLQPQYVQPQQEGVPVAGLAAVPVAYDPNKSQGMVQVQPAPAGGYVYPTQQQQNLQPYPPQQGYVDNRASLAPSSSTPVSALAPQTTGTTNVSELSTSGLVSGASISPGPAPIAEADESAAVAAAAAYQQQLYQQQVQQQYYQQQAQYNPQGPQPPAPGYASALPVYGQPQPAQAVFQAAPAQAQAQQAVFHEAGDGQPAPMAPVEMASSGEVVSPLSAATAQPTGHPQGHPPH
ncbi:hypothetical protein SBRCBS47491_003643 [Sporothrix bragantina]|uniref:Uncharacterized protein n=1 Tax=Sporothrix bragantina TaxID=671064 RepID=A0ABP0BH52_9PEZI